MDKRKVTRRAALGATIGGLATAPFILRALKGKYENDLPMGEAPPVLVGGTRTVNIDGHEITIKTPKMEIKGPEDQKRYREIIAEELKKDPTFLAALKMRKKNWEEKNVELRMAELDEKERQLLAKVADSGLGEQGKSALLAKVKSGIQASREKAKKWLDDSDK